jgi:hypothetical protein
MDCMKTNNAFFCILFSILFLSLKSINGQDILFPQVDGWKVEVEKQIYDSNNLWNIIDGAADLFLEYSFVDLHIARYTNSAGIDIKVELYKHTSPTTAFGIYSQERDPDYKFIKIGTQGYIDPGILNFLDGVYYIKLSSVQSGNEVQNALQLIAGKVSENLKQENTLPKILQAFPDNGKQYNSEQYIAQNFLGYSFLKSAFTSAYKNVSLFKMFIIINENGETANTALGKIILAMPKENIVKLNSDNYELNDPNNGLISIVLQDKFLYGTINCTDKATREYLLKDMSKKLSKY